MTNEMVAGPRGKEAELREARALAYCRKAERRRRRALCGRAELFCRALLLLVLPAAAAILTWAVKRCG